MSHQCQPPSVLTIRPPTPCTQHMQIVGHASWSSKGQKQQTSAGACAQGACSLGRGGSRCSASGVRLMQGRLAARLEGSGGGAGGVYLPEEQDRVAAAPHQLVGQRVWQRVGLSGRRLGGSWAGGAPPIHAKRAGPAEARHALCAGSMGGAGKDRACQAMHARLRRVAELARQAGRQCGGLRVCACVVVGGTGGPGQGWAARQEGQWRAPRRVPLRSRGRVGAQSPGRARVRTPRESTRSSSVSASPTRVTTSARSAGRSAGRRTNGGVGWRWWWGGAIWCQGGAPEVSPRCRTQAIGDAARDQEHSCSGGLDG